MKPGLFKSLQSRLLRDKAVSDLARGAGLALFLRCLGAGAALLLNIVIGRTLGLEGAGLYFTALSLAAILAVVTRLGIDNALLRLISASVAAGDWPAARGFFRTGAGIVAGSGMVFAVCVILTAPVLADNVFGQAALHEPLRWIAPSIVFFALMMVMSESLRGAGRIRDAVLVSGALYPLCALVFISPLATWLGAGGAALAYSLGTALAASYGLWSWRNLVRNEAPAGQVETGRMASIAGKLWIVTLINSALIPWVPVLALGALYGPEETAQLGAATRLAVLVSFIFVAANTVLAPKFAKLEQEGDRGEMIRIASRFSLLTILVSSPILIVMIFFPGFVMGLFGPGFGDGGAALSIIVTGQAINAATGSVASLLLLTDHETDVRNAALFSAIVLVAASVLLLPPLGLLGAAAANAAAVAAANLYAWVMVRKRLGRWVFPR